MSLGENSLVAAYQGRGQLKSRPSGTRVVTVLTWDNSLLIVLTYFGHLIRDWYRPLARLGRHCFAFSCGARPILGVMLLHPHPVYSNLVSRPGCRLPSALRH